MADGEQRSRGGADGDVSAWMQLGVVPVVGRLADTDARGVLVEVPGQSTPVLARSLVVIDRTAIADRREVLLVFEQGRADRPIVLGLLQDPAAVPDVARVDGRRVVLEGKDEIELRCGAASITLRRNGRIVIRGVDVETRAKGRNRIRGGSVAIN